MLLLDEPTAHLDRESATAVSGAIAALRGKVTVLLVAHDRQTRELADVVVAVAPGVAGTATAAAVQDADAATALTGAGVARAGRCRRRDGCPCRTPVRSRPVRIRACTTSCRQTPRAQACRKPARSRPARTQPGVPQNADTPLSPGGSTAARLRRLLAPVAAKFAAAGAVGTLAALFAVALAGLSGWLIIRASEQPPILYLLTAIVGVRFFGIGRAVLRYLERLLLHDAVFAALTRLRGRLWESLSRRALSLRRLLQGGNVLGTVVDDVDTVRELLPRVVLPPLTAVAVAAAAVASVAWLLPAALPAVIAAAL